MSEEMLSSIRQKFKQLIADSYMTFQGTRGARHGAQPWQKHHFPAKGFMRKIGIAFKMMKNFMQANNITGRKNGANIWLTSEQSILRTKLLQNNWNDTLSFSVRFETNGKRTHKKPSRLPSYYTSNRKHEQRSRSDSRIKRRHDYREDLDPEKFDWLLRFSHKWKWF